MSDLKQHKIFFPNLDGLRFFSFLFVFLSHSFLADNPAIMETTWYKLIKVRIFSDGDIGVCFFFVLSGFLISFLLFKEKEFTGKIDVKSFYIRRILRIWPLYYFVVVFGFLIFPVIKSHLGQVPNETANPVLCSTFLNNFDRIYHGQPDSSLLGTLWSVAIEEQFYLVWPLLFFMAPANYFKSILVSVIGISVLFRVFFINRTVIDVHTLGVMVDLAIGGYAAYLITYNKPFLSRIEQISKSFIRVLYFLVFIYVVFRPELFYNMPMLIFGRVLVAITFALIILEQNFAKNSLFKVGNFKLISAMGKFTYGLYCLHGLGILISLTLLRKLGLNQSSWQIWLLQLPLAFLSSVVICWFSFNYYEGWFLKFKSKFAYITKE